MIKFALLATLALIIINSVDRLLSWQTFARPIVTATITGLLFGDLQTGIVMGASLEAIFMGISAIGGSIPADPCVSSIIAVAFTIISGMDIEAGLALAMPIGTLLGSVGELYKPVQASFAPHFEHLAETGQISRMRKEMIIFGMFLDKLPQTLVLFFSIAYGVEGLQTLMASLPTWVMSGFSAAASMMTGVGFAILATMIWDKEIAGFFFVGFVLAKYLNLGTLPIAILAMVVAIMYFYNDKKMVDMKASMVATGSNENVNNEEDFF